MIGNVTNPPNGFLKAYYSNTVLSNQTVLFDNTFNNTPNQITGIFKQDDTSFTTPISIPLLKITKKMLVKVLCPDYVLTPNKFIAHCNLIGENFGTPNMTSRLAMREGDEVELYGIEEIKRLVFLQNNYAPQDYLLQISLFK